MEDACHIRPRRINGCAESLFGIVRLCSLLSLEMRSLRGNKESKLLSGLHKLLVSPQTWRAFLERIPIWIVRLCSLLSLEMRSLRGNKESKLLSGLHKLLVSPQTWRAFLERIPIWIV